MTRRRRARAALAATALAGSLAVTAAAVGAATIPDGLYAGLALKRFATANVQFSVTDHGTAVHRPTLYCVSHDTTYNGGAPGGEISVTAPPLTIHGGSLRYQGSAAVRPPSTFTIAAHAPLHLTLRHVSGPVVHYRVRGVARRLTTAWTGTVSSPACSTIAAGGLVRLFGPIPGR